MLIALNITDVIEHVGDSSTIFTVLKQYLTHLIFLSIHRELDTYPDMRP